MATSVHHQDSKASSKMEVDVLIVGAGPAGASLASFLARDNISGLMISAASSTAKDPRAHYTNLAAMDALRDLGLQDECYRSANFGESTSHVRWADSMTGEEYMRVHMGGSRPDRLSDYAAASPCRVVDLPQTLLEPILIKYATTNGFKARFDTQFVRFEELGDGRISSMLMDTVTGVEFQVISKYLCGADGGRSAVAKQLDLPMVAQAGPTGYNVVIKADLSNLMTHRAASLNVCLRLEKDYPFSCIYRMVKPWNEWLFSAFPKLGLAYDEPTKEEWLEIIKDTIGNPNIPIEIVTVSRWRVNETYAEQYSKGNVFCLGDAVHRHPPTGGLGSNTCIQDAFNLAWKMSLVLKNLASPTLLSTYNSERQPVGQAVVKQSLEDFRAYWPAYEAIGITLPTAQERKDAISKLGTPGEANRAMRKQLRKCLYAVANNEMQALGVEMGQLYVGSSTAVYTLAEQAPFSPKGKEAENPAAFYTPSTYPGRRLPHVWLDQATPSGLVSTLDLAGKGAFCLLTGPGGHAWKDAAGTVSKKLGVQINSYMLGFRQDWEDVYGDWARICEDDGIEEDGCILARPDLFVSWRAKTLEAELDKKLEVVMKAILGF